MPILKTRLHKPQINDRFIFRKRLINQLNKGFNLPVRLISAGAGFGKSTLVSQWLDSNVAKYSWVSLEEDCNEKQVFLSYLVHGIQGSFPMGLPKMGQIISGNSFPPNPLIAQTLINELEDLGDSIILVLDDLHKITNPDIWDFLNFLISEIPENLKLTLISRTIPPIERAKLKAYDQIVVIGIEELRADSSEILQIAKKSSLQNLDEQTASLIGEKTEGWILGVNLILKDYVESGIESFSKLPTEIKENTEQVLFELFLKTLNPNLQQILMVAALFERFNFDLMRELFRNSQNPKVSQNPIAENFDDLFLKGIRFFLIELDNENHWFRLHHLIGEIFKNRLLKTISEKEIEKYYRIAGEFFEELGFYEEGIRYSLQGRNEEFAIAIIESNWQKLIDSGENLRLSRWVNQIPLETSSQSSTIFLIRAFLCDTFADFSSMKKYLENVEMIFESQTPTTRTLGAYASIHSGFSAYTGDYESALNLSSQALELLSHDQRYLISYALNFKILSLSLLDSSSVAQEILVSLKSKLSEKTPREKVHILALSLLFEGNHASLEELEYSGQLVVEIGRNEKNWWMVKLGYYYLSLFYYLKNDLSKTYQFIDSGIECLFNSGPTWTLQMYFTGSLAALGEKNLPKAKRYLDDSKTFLEQTQMESFNYYIKAFEVEFYLRINDVEKAWQLNREAKYTSHPILYYYYIPHFTPIKLFIKKGGERLMEEAFRMIEEYEKKSPLVPYAKIQLLLIKAEWYLQSNSHKQALEVLNLALDEVKDENYLRVFLDTEHDLKELILNLQEHTTHTPLIRKISSLILSEIGKEQPLTSKNQHRLTSKDLDILELVAKGYKNREIADKLFLSETTVKTYLYKIYQNLNVKNRTGAVLKYHEIMSSGS
ncbi:MAG: hypothetical protein EP311_08980 [Cytophagales bacterium]|nr:MAG: hypothetical protein EP311_08980 [Cytophagales bacterium]